MLRKLLLLLTLSALPAGCLADDAQATSSRNTTDVLRLKIYRHSVWSETPPKGVDGDGLRMNLAPGDSLHFRDLTVTVTQLIAGREGSQPDQVRIALGQNTTTESLIVDEGAAFNWNGYHVAIVAVYTRKGELGFGSAVVEVATVDSLPREVAQSDKANGPEWRLRVKHTIDKLTVHHSATTHTVGQDLRQKLRNLQKWGESDRNWFDIAYHFIIDLDGTIYEARDYHYAGDTNTRYDTRGHFLINCFGNYNEAEPNQQQLEAIAGLMAWAAAEFDIQPLKIYGHRDLAQSACPGDNLYRYVKDGTLQRMVEEILAKGKPELVWVDRTEQNSE